MSRNFANLIRNLGLSRLRIMISLQSEIFIAKVVSSSRGRRVRGARTTSPLLIGIFFFRQRHGVE